jgi:membrane protease YdiL (CAAX protease family)
MILQTDRCVPTGPVARVLVTILCGAVWYVLQQILYGAIPETDVVFLRAGVVSFLAALPLLAVCSFYPLRCGLWGLIGGLRSSMVTLILILPFVAAGLAQEMSGVFPGTGWFATAFMLFLLAAAEEMVFRGFLLNVLGFGARFLPGAILSSILFALVHADNAGATILGVVNIALFGFMLALLRLISGGIVIPSIVHWVWNLMTGMVFGWRVSGYELPSLLSPVKGRIWGSFGPEGSLLLTLVLVVGTAVALRLSRRHSLL